MPEAQNQSSSSKNSSVHVSETLTQSHLLTLRDDTADKYWKKQGGWKHQVRAPLVLDNIEESQNEELLSQFDDLDTFLTRGQTPHISQIREGEKRLEEKWGKFWVDSTQALSNLHQEHGRLYTVDRLWGLKLALQQPALSQISLKGYQ